MQDLLLALVTSLVVSVVTLLVARMAQVLPGRRLWRLGNRRTIVIALSNTVDKPTKDYPIPATGIGQVRALGALSPALHRAYGRRLTLITLLASEVTGEHMSRDLLLIGGPARNAVTKEAMERLSATLPVRQGRDPRGGSGDRLYWRELDGTQEELVGPASGTGGITRDYAVVVRTPNPFNLDRSCIIVSGTRTYGTGAAGEWLARQNWNWSILVSRRSGFVALLESEVAEDGHVTSVRLRRPIRRLGN